MSYDANVIRRATQRLEEERRARADQTERRRLAAYAKQPRLAQIDRELRATMAGLAALRSADAVSEIRGMKLEAPRK